MAETFNLFHDKEITLMQESVEVPLFTSIEELMANVALRDTIEL